MADSWIIVTDPLDGTERKLLLKDNNDSLTHSIGVHEVAPTGINGGPVTVGTSAVELTFTGTTKVISIKAASTNTGLIWFGLTGIGNDGTAALGELTADAAVEIELDDAAAAIFVISDTVAQTVYKAALT